MTYPYDSRFLTCGEIAKNLNRAETTVREALKLNNIEPVAKANQCHIFSRFQQEQVRKILLKRLKRLKGPKPEEVGYGLMSDLQRPDLDDFMRQPTSWD